MTPEQQILRLVGSIVLLLVLADGFACMFRGVFPGMKAFPITRWVVRTLVRATRNIVGGTLVATGTAVRGTKPKKGTRRRRS